MSPPLFSSTPGMFRDRADAGDRLAEALRPHLATLTPADIVIVGLARGGVVVAAEVARMLDVRLETIVVRKLGAPDQPELALGAIAADGSRVLNDPLIERLGLSQEDIDRITRQATDAARILCDDLGVSSQIEDIEGRTVVLIDDGMATGATMRVAIESVYRQGARQVIVGLPVAPDTAETELEEYADDVIILLAPHQLQAVGQWYQAFPDVPTGQVRKALQDNPWSNA
ncbi:MAG TPA: phosphoribosyltransferase family protein [Thermomicrobiales bacterium]|nr:phosphoribosyltransferase family protein [Thermomicrobiales bacterium]